MTGSTEGGAPEGGDWIDESAAVPGPKAYRPPLQPAPPDRMRVEIDVRSDGLSVKGGVHVHRGLHDAANYVVICGVAVLTAVVAVGLCLALHAAGRVTLVLAAVSFCLVLALGLAHISIGSRRDP